MITMYEVGNIIILLYREEIWGTNTLSNLPKGHKEMFDLGFQFPILAPECVHLTTTERPRYAGYEDGLYQGWFLSTWLDLES